MRIVKHNRGRVARGVKAYMEYNDYALFGAPLILSFFCFVVFGIALTVEVSQWFLLILAPAAWSLLVGAVYLMTSVKPSDGYALYREATENVWPKIKGHKFEEGLGRPIFDKMYQHWRDGHPGVGHSSNSQCRDCRDRLEILRELVPAQIKSNDKSDIEAARNFLDSRKELEG